MGKRGNTQGAAKMFNKKAKTDPAFDSIVDVICSSEQIPERCRNMLVDMLPFSLSLAMDKRHDLQTVAVNMVEETLMARKSSLQDKLATENEKFDTLKASETGLLQATKDCENALAAQKDSVDTSKRSLAEVTSLANASSDSLEEKRAAQKIASENISKTKEEKASVELAFETHFKAPFEQGPHYQELEPFLKDLELEASLVTALPSSCAKTKEQRGSFDDLVLQELDKAFNVKISALDSKIQTDTPTLVEHDTAVENAGKDLEANKEKQKQAAFELDAALKEQQCREEALNNANVAVEEFKPQLESLAEQLETAKEALAVLEAGPLATFATYKCKTSVVDGAAALGA